jgi:hypothetical protein
MADLRISGVSNNQLELQAPDGTRHYLSINDDLVKALRNREVSLPATLTPREIQQQIRLGATVSEVAAATGADEELVLKFAKPIISELNHIVTLARNIRLSLAGDRFAEPTPVQFGEVMDERLANNGARDIVWSSRKNIEGEWLVSINFATSEGTGIATWGFDPKQLFLTPENEAALQLSNGVPVSAVSKTVPMPTETKPENTNTSIHPSLSVVPEVVAEPVVTEEPEMLEELFEEEPVINTNPLRIVTDADLPQSSPATEQIDIVEEVEVIEVVEVVEEPFVEELAAEEDNSTKEEATKPTTNSRWAEVLFGSKEDEDEN